MARSSFGVSECISSCMGAWRHDCTSWGISGAWRWQRRRERRVAAQTYLSVAQRGRSLLLTTVMWWHVVAAAERCRHGAASWAAVEARRRAWRSSSSVPGWPAVSPRQPRYPSTPPRSDYRYLRLTRTLIRVAVRRKPVFYQNG